MFSHRSDDYAASYVSHLDELRARLFYCLAAVMAGMIAAWFLARPAYKLIAGVVVNKVTDVGGQIITLHPAEFFLTQMKIALVLGLILASPVVLWQLWGFIRPGLTPRERRVAAPVVPMIAGLFLFGAAVAWLMMPNIMAFFLSYRHTFDGVRVVVSFEQTIDFPLSIMLAFGIAFQLPIVLLGLVWLRILSARMMLTQWRVAVVILAVVAGVVTPTNDMLTMTAMLVPLLFLYFGTVWVALRIQKSSEAREAAEVSE